MSNIESKKIIQIEQALLGLVLINPKNDTKTSQVFHFLDDSYFSTNQTKTLFSVLKHFYESKIPNYDLKLIQKYLEDNDLTKIINLSYLNDVIDSSGYLSSLNEYIDVLIEQNKKQKLINTFSKLKTEINSNNSQDLIEKLRNNLYEIEERKINKDFQTAEQVVSEVVNEIFQQNKEIKGIKTGFSYLDKITNGLQNGDLIILAARPSVGKTAFALNLALNAMQYDHKNVAFFSLEMPSKQLIQRLLSCVSNVASNRIKANNNSLESNEVEKILEAKEKIKKMKLFIDDSASIKLDEIIWKSRKQKEQGNLDLIIIDYLQLIPTSSYNDNRQQEVSKISRSLKQLARELNVPIVALSQLNRRVELREEKKPMMSDLRESGAIEQDADIIAFLYRDEYYHQNSENKKDDLQIVELNIAKHRNGSIGKIDLCFIPSLGKFKHYVKESDEMTLG